MRADDNLPVMLWTVRPDMSCEYVNRAWLEFTGFPPDQALGRGWSRVVHPEDLARWLDTCVRAFDAREPFEIEYRMRRYDGEYRWVLDHGGPRYSPDGLFLGYSGACLDIDRRRRGERDLARALERERRLRAAVEEASRAKDGFLAAVLNELQPHTQAMATWAAHLRGKVVASSESEALEAIERSARMQNLIITNLLELSHLAGRAPLARPLNEPLLSGVRVLVVDDDPPARELLLKVLEVAGAETRSATSSAQALEVLGDWHPDIMVSDLGMRGDDGYVLIRAVRSLPAERGGCTRAAALSVASEPQGQQAVAAGYDAQLAKPVEPVALLATVARLV